MSNRLHIIRVNVPAYEAHHASRTWRHLQRIVHDACPAATCSWTDQYTRVTLAYMAGGGALRDVVTALDLAGYLDEIDT